jgi:hypothetical protein
MSQGGVNLGRVPWYQGTRSTLGKTNSPIAISPIDAFCAPRTLDVNYRLMLTGGGFIVARLYLRRRSLEKV